MAKLTIHTRFPEKVPRDRKPIVGRRVARNIRGVLARNGVTLILIIL